MGKFIAIDGLDGSGKATQAELLKKHFERKHGANAYYGQKK